MNENNLEINISNSVNNLKKTFKLGYKYILYYYYF